MAGSSHSCEFQLYSFSCCKFQLYALLLLCLLLYLYIPMLFMSASKINTVVDGVFHGGSCDNVWKIENDSSTITIGEKLWMWCWTPQALFRFSFQASKRCCVFLSRQGGLSHLLAIVAPLRPNFEQEWDCLKWHGEADECVGVWPVELKRCRQT